MNRALIVIDVQESFRARAEWEQIANPKIAEPVNRLVRLARTGSDLVVWVLHTEPGSQGAATSDTRSSSSPTPPRPTPMAGSAPK